MKKYFPIFLICFASFFFNAAIFAEEQSNAPTKTENTQAQPTSDPFADDPFLKDEHNEPDNFQAKFMNMILLLGLIIAFMLLASWMLKRLARSRVEQMNSASSIKVLETRSLSPRSTVYLIDVMGQGLVIAESHTGVTHLATVPLEETDLEEPPRQSPKTFKI